MNSIEEYFALTGRPIATMTVDEYIKLKSVENVASNIVNVAPVTAPVEFNVPLEAAKEPVKAEPSIKPNNKAPKPVKSEDRKNMALMMLRSIDG